MNALQLLSLLRKRGIHLWAEDGYLEYEAPEGALTAAVLEQIAAHKQDLLSLLAQSEGSDQVPPLEAGPRHSTYPLSFSQERLWFLHQLEPDSSAYNMSLALRLSGSLDVAALSTSLKRVMARHAIFRTSFPTIDDKPVQVISEECFLSLRHEDLRTIPRSECEARVNHLIAEECLQPFSLVTGPLIRVGLLQTEETEHVLVVVLHHIVTDGWSRGLLIRDLGAFYTEEVTKQPSALPVLSIQYVDYAVWQREWLQGAVLEEQLRYWRGQLADLAPLELPTDRPRPAQQTFGGSSSVQLIDLQLTNELRNLSHRSGVSLAITLLAAFQVLIAKYTGQTDVAVGSPIANRTRQEIEGLIGFFVNSLVLRSDLSGDPSLEEVLHRVKVMSLEAYDHQDLPFERIVDELQPERDPSRNPLFQVMFAVQNAPREDMSLPGLTMAPFSLPITQTRFDLECHVREQAEGLSVVLMYNTDLFDAVTIEQLGRHYRRVLAELVRGPEQRLSQLCLLDEGELTQQVVEWNTTATVYPRERTIVELFAEQVAAGPEAVAVVDEARQLTYAELDRRANQLAHYLRQHGVGPEVCVGLCLERSVELVVGVLGILKAGGAYVPLDPKLPPERLAFILNETNLALVLLHERFRASLPSEWGGVVVALDGAGGRIESLPETPVDSGATAANLAYLMYTSGSTGVPKGINICHRNVVRLVKQTNYLKVDPDDTFLQLAPLAFDASTFELWGSLLHGAKLVLFPPHVPSLDELGQCLQEQGISTLWLTAALFHQMVDTQRAALCGVPHLLAGGDVLSVAHVNQVLAHLWKGGRLINGYGPTENTTFTCCHVMEAGSEVGASVPIGHPIANTQVYILDRPMQPVPVGVYGELAIGGEGLGRGYLHRPALTAEKFVPHPWSAEPGARVYQTGDVVRYRRDGVIEFKGRRDQQVKLRGYRVELGEIEAVLTHQPTVAEAVAVVREDVPGDQRLVAYVVPDPTQLGGLTASTKHKVWQGEHITTWQSLYEDTYGAGLEDSNPLLNLTGWNSSYTGKAIPQKEMEEWVEATVERIQGLQPRRVLEIGCGTGLLLYRLAPTCEQYVGTDFSAVALDGVRQGLVSRSELQHVQLEQRLADNLQGFAPGSFDTIIINSVTQYFPSMDYLAQVLTDALALLQPGGCLFVGDVRSLPLLAAYQASIQLFKAEESLPTGELAQRIQQGQAREEELVIDPAFFMTLAHQVPTPMQVEILWKQGQTHNELTRFRYDVILHKEPPEDAHAAIDWRDWESEGLSVTGLSTLVTAQRGDVLGLKNIPNARLHTEGQVLDWLGQSSGLGTVAELREMLRAEQGEGVDPQALWTLEVATDYWCEVGESGHDAPGRMSAVWRRRTPGRRPCVLPWHGRPSGQEQGWAAYGTNPLKEKLVQALVPTIRGALEAQVPEYMVPSAFVFLEQLPLTPNGKVNRRALPAPEGTRAQVGTAYVAPGTPTGEAVAAIWREVLGLEQVGIHDNFFDLGGHSLLATKIISKIHSSLSKKVSLKEFLQNPTVAGIAGQIHTMDPKEAGEVDFPRPLGNRPTPIPLSYAQERFWFLDQFQTQPEAFAHLRAYRLLGPLNVEALRQSFQTLVNRHESFRTTFVAVGGQPQQTIAPSVEVDLSVTELGGLPESEGIVQANKIMQEEGRPFELDRGPLFRIRIIKLHDRNHLLIFNAHHSVIDAASMEVLNKEISHLYNSFCAGKAPELTPLPLQYADYAVWQREYIAGDIGSRQLAFWTRQLADLPAAIPMPRDFPRSSYQKFKGGRITKVFSSGLCQKLQALKTSERCTTFMLFLSGIQLILHRFSGLTDICVGAPVSGRVREQLNPLIGCFLNNLALRTDLSGRPTFRTLLHRVRDVVAEAFDHQDIPFEKLLKELHPIREPGVTPIFQVLLNMHNFADREFDFKGVETSKVPVPYVPSLFDWTLYFQEFPDGLPMSLVYNVSLFSEARMSELLEQFEGLFQQVVDNPDRPIDTYTLVTQRSQGVLPDPTEPLRVKDQKNIVEMFAQQVLHHPENIAITDPGGTVSYKELDERSNQVAQYLRSHGVKPGDVVAIYAHRDASFVCALVGVLKTGASFLVLEPTYPEGRLHHILELVKPKGMISLETGTALPPLLDSYVQSLGCHCVIPSMVGSGLEENRGLWSYPCTPLAFVVRSEDMAYLMVTSGTSGIPQCVQNAHRPLSHFLAWYTKKFQLTETDRVTLFSGLGHDPVLRDIFAPLWVGGRICIPDSDVYALGQVGSWIKDQGITVTHLTPAYLEMLGMAKEETEMTYPSIRQVVCGGDRLLPSHVESLRKLMPKATWINCYGATETPQIMSYFVIPTEEEKDGQAISIGQGIDGVQLLVLNQMDQLAGVGELGEICIRTPYLAMGYFRNPVLTQAKFQANPFGGEKGDRVFRTGDLGRFRPDGTVELAGRKDRQVKIRGYRIELEDIEAVLRTHEKVREAVVVYREDTANTTQLAAFVIPVRKSVLSSSELRTFLEAQVPGYMLPNAFVLLEKFPLTPNGKVDYRQLSVSETPDVISPYLAPETLLEKTLASIWEEVLGGKRVGMDQNFFVLGGHSLLATQVVSRIREQLQVELKLKTFFQVPTIRGLAHMLEMLYPSLREAQDDSRSDSDKRSRVLL